MGKTNQSGKPHNSPSYCKSYSTSQFGTGNRKRKESLNNKQKAGKPTYFDKLKIMQNGMRANYCIINVPYYKFFLIRTLNSSFLDY